MPRQAGIDVRSLRTAEDVFVEIGRTFRSSGDKAAWIADRTHESHNKTCPLHQSRSPMPAGWPYLQHL